MDLRMIRQIAYGAATAERIDPDIAVLQLSNGRYMSFDTETTGLDPEQDRILEVGAVLFEKGEPFETFHSYMNPEMEIRPEVSALNHITGETVRMAPTEAELLAKLLSFMQECMTGDMVVCGHVTAFDLCFLCAAMERQGLAAAFRFVDTRQIATQIPELTSHSLAATAEYFGIPHERAHHATDDATVSGLILAKAIEKRNNNV